ncbi:MAG: DUF3102 domain-containing protein [Planctomycetota bacterium]|nr:DUF3102 domain-containing protein [Planctomycetota bacterium]
MPDSIVTQATNLSQLAMRINEEHAKAEAAMRDGLSHAVEAGKLLIEAKAQHKHGGWLKWLAANFTSTPRTAQNYMWLSVRMLDEAKAKSVSHLGCVAAVQHLRREESVAERKERRMAYLEEAAKRARNAGDTGEVQEQELVVTEERHGPEGYLFRVTRRGSYGTHECIDPEYLELKRTEMDKDLWHLVTNAKEGLMLAQQALGDLVKHCNQHGSVHEDMHTVDQWHGVEYPCVEILEQGKDVSESLNAAFGIVDEKLKAEAEAIMAEWGIEVPERREQGAELEAVGA